jgi:hypothetical protein
VLAELEVSDTPQPPAAPDRDAIALAEQLLSEGRAEAERRQGERRTWAGVGIGCAALAALGGRSIDVTRRRLLRNALHGAALASLAPGIGFSILSEVFAPSQIRAFDSLANRLTRLNPRNVEQFLA